MKILINKPYSQLPDHTGFCAHCKHHVTDISHMTDIEIMAAGPLHCITARADQLNREMQPRRIPRYKALWAALLTGLTLTRPVVAQQKDTVKTHRIDTTNTGTFTDYVIKTDCTTNAKDTVDVIKYQGTGSFIMVDKSRTSWFRRCWRKIFH